MAELIPFEGEDLQDLSGLSEQFLSVFDLLLIKLVDFFDLPFVEAYLLWEVLYE